jgi:hypothetical protein
LLEQLYKPLLDSNCQHFSCRYIFTKVWIKLWRPESINFDINYLSQMNMKLGKWQLVLFICFFTSGLKCPSQIISGNIVPSFHSFYHLWPYSQLDGHLKFPTSGSNGSLNLCNLNNIMEIIFYPWWDLIRIYSLERWVCGPRRVLLHENTYTK